MFHQIFAVATTEDAEAMSLAFFFWEFGSFRARGMFTFYMGV